TEQSDARSDRCGVASAPRAPADDEEIRAHQEREPGEDEGDELNVSRGHRRESLTADRAILTIGNSMRRSEPIKAVRGVRDLLPAELPIWSATEQAARDVAHRFGYEEIVTPVLEHAELIERVGE